MHTARLWRSLGHHDHAGAFHIDGVTGPDEYSAIVDDNVFTNLMAEQNLRVAADLAARHSTHARALGVDDEEIAAWRDAAAGVHIPFDRRLGVHPQNAGFTRRQVMDLEQLTEDEYPLLLHVPYFRLYGTQVVKQPDLVLALLQRGDRFSAQEKARDFAYYEALTVRDSSLSACIQATVAAEVGHVELAYDYFGEAAMMDLDDLEHNTRDGLHMASLAGSWIAAVAGFGGMRDHGGELSFRPRLPAALARLRFRLLYRGRCLQVEITHASARYELLHGDALELRHEREMLSVEPGRPQTRGWTLPEPGPEPRNRRGASPGDAGSTELELLATGAEVDRADRCLVGQLGEHLAEHAVHVGLVVPEVVVHRAQRRVHDLQLRGRQVERERDVVGPDQVLGLGGHVPKRTDGRG